MGSDGQGEYIGTQQTRNKAKRLIGGRVRHNSGQTCVCVGKWSQGWCDRHKTTTENVGEL